MLWITESSKQEAQRQSQTARGKGLNQSLCRLPNTQTQIQRSYQNEKIKNRHQIKEQESFPEEELDEMETSNLSDKSLE